MSSATTTTLNSAASVPENLLAKGVAFLVGVTFVQRFFGLARQAIFCGYLTDEQLGRWSIAFSFLTIAAPLVVFGIPGSFGRYVQHYRGRDQLRTYLRQTLLAVTVPATLLVALVVFLAPQFAQWLYGDVQYTGLVVGLAVTLEVLIVFNGLVELLMALRLPQAASVAHFVNSVCFTVLAWGLLWGSSWREGGVVLACVASMVVAGFIGWFPLRKVWRELPREEPPLAGATLWRRVLPYAGWVWVGNLVTNACDLGDQLLIKHCAGVEPAIADGLVGQYYTARIIPNTLASLAAMIAASLVPFLVIDWERGRRDLVSDRLNSWLKMVSLSFTAIGAIVIWVAPPFFRWALPGKFDAGMELLPWTATFCVWGGMAVIVKKCLVCAERGGLATASLCVPLVLTIGLNLILIPRFGLKGVVLAAAAASLADLLVSYLLNVPFGSRLDLGGVLATALPATLVLGPGAALCMTLVICVAGFTPGSSILSRAELDDLARVWQRRNLPG